ncbi:iron complex transport system substrate-binding protein [Sphingobacterium nematocida]|uniref:Iron complex transport system substrate-binding protein n=1 Tax=Sphingobacterium nematocida TaxID=1513896 RepID=A0A1T5C9E3_9SPHI|nr:hypothetical protein [Sphingobacterium nematocida]SKB56054.1 iron complex transport system substrate-binding protein [Sphingobacterium nematocida]
MTKYDEIIATLRHKDSQLAEHWEEEIDTIIHKLKFLTSDAIPSVCIVDQSNGFQIVNSLELQEKVKIAGGTLATDFDKNIGIFIILQKDDSLYSVVPSFIQEQQDTKAVANNNLFIIHNSQFNTTDENYLQDIEILAEIIQSKYFIFGRDGLDWIKFDLA